MDANPTQIRCKSYANPAQIPCNSYTNTTHRLLQRAAACMLPLCDRSSLCSRSISACFVHLYCAAGIHASARTQCQGDRCGIYRRHQGGTREAPRRHQGGTVGLKKVLPPTRYCLTQSVTSGGNTFSQPRGGQGVGASSSLGREVPCRGVRKARRGSVCIAILAQLHAACAD